MFVDSMRIIPFSEATVVDVEHSLTHKTHFVSPQNVVYKQLSHSVLMQQFAKLHPYRMMVWKLICIP
jgi:hypothetical protein